MEYSPSDSLAVKLVTLYMRLIGFWNEETHFAKRLRTLLLFFSFGFLLSGVLLTAVDLSFNLHDIDATVYCCLNLFVASFVTFKLTVFTIKRKMYLDLINYARKHYWCITYHGYAADIMKKCMDRASKVILFAILMCHLTSSMYAVNPILINRGVNQTDRILPITLHLNLPLTWSPYYEIIFILEMLCVYPSTIVYFCFDNFLCQMNLTLVGNFMILQKDLMNMCDKSNDRSLQDESFIREYLTRCVRKHQELINICKIVKELYSTFMLGTVVGLSALICVELYKAMMTIGVTPSRVQYCFYAFGSISQLFLSCLTCNDLNEASVSLSDAAYNVQWYLITSKIKKNELVKDLSMIILRSQKACTLTVGGFSPVTLETFRGICNTAFSFLTLIRKRAQKL